MTQEEINEILAAHNKYRDEVGVPHLEWDEALATNAANDPQHYPQNWPKSAQDWANDMASRPQNPEHSTQAGWGENIGWWFRQQDQEPDKRILTQLVDQWGAEKRYFIHTLFGNEASCTGDWRDVGHYTQVVWENTTKVGCGFARGSVPDSNGWVKDVLVCHYDPGGNQQGNSVFSQSVSILECKKCTIITDRSNFGHDEILAISPELSPVSPAVIPNAFYVVVDCFHPEWLGITAKTLSGKPDVAPSISSSVSGIGFDHTACSVEGGMLLSKKPQRFTWTYQVTFTDDSIFPQGPQETRFVKLTASISSLATSEMPGITVTDQAVITLTQAAYPYELDGADWWLSTDLRVFQIRADDSRFGMTLSAENADADPAKAALDFIQNVITNLNDPNWRGETFAGISTDPGASWLELSGVVKGKKVFNFALAKVHYRGPTGIPDVNVRVFFRLFPAATTSTAFDPKTTYRRTTQGDVIPLLGHSDSYDLLTIPCFAEPRINSAEDSMTAQTDKPNVASLSGSGAEVVRYFGCWLDINQSEEKWFPIQLPIDPLKVDGPYEADRKSIQELMRNVHQCLIAEIAVDPDHLIPPDLIPEGFSPAGSDKLAQRNLMIVESANPGDIASHRILQTFDIRPTAASLPSNQMPDELMIDWGDVPTDSKANIYLPGTSTDTILAMAGALYARHGLSRVDDHTLACQARGITYIPIPPGVGSNFAGLLTIDLPATVRNGQAFRVITRQITNASSQAPDDVIVIRWRQTVGTFQITIPVSTKEALLKPALRQLAVLKYIAQSIPPDNWWSPVFGRYLQGFDDRVRALGGNPEAVLPSPAGDVQNGKPFAKDVPYIGTWLVLGPIFDPAHQPGSHLGDVPPRPHAGEIILDIDNHKDQLDPLVLTTPGNAPSQDDVVRYGGKGAGGKTVLSERVYTWRERYFGGLDWNSLNDIKDDVHTHLGGDYDDDPFDPYNYLNFAGKYHALALLLVYIISPDDRTTRIALRHDDAVRVWLNGGEIKNNALPFLLDHDIIAEDETFAEITLRSGTNVLLVAVAETHADWGFSARIEDYQGLRITTDRPDRDPIVASESQYHSVNIAGSGNLWYPRDLNRALTCVGKRKWKGRVKMADEHFKIVGHQHHWIPDWWGPNGLDIFLDNFHNEIPGVYDIIFFENDPTHPVLILVKPFAAR